MADDAGALLVRTGLISDQALLSARKAQATTGGTLGEQLVLQGAVQDEQLTEFYRARLLVPRVNPNTLAKLSPTVVEAIPGELAIEFRAVPVSLDREGNLTVAMSDPSDRHAVDELGFFTGKYVVRAVATQMQVAWCLAHYYGHITDLGQRLLKPSANGTPAIAPAAPEAAAPNAPVPRVRGFTGRIEASRHKVLPPVLTDSVKEIAIAPRPSDEILTPTPEDVARVAAAAKAIANASERDTATPEPLTTPQVSEPYAQVHVSLANDDKTPATGLQTPQRRRPAEPDPPELAARAGEVELPVRGRPSGTIDAEMPAVMVELEPEPAEAFDPQADPETPVTPIEVPIPPEISAAPVVTTDEDSAELSPVPDPDEEELDSAAIVHDMAGGTESQPILLTAAKPRMPARDTLPEDSGEVTLDDDEDEPVMLVSKKPVPEPPVVPEAIVDEPSGSIEDAVRRAAGKRRTAKHTQIGMGVPIVPPRPSSQLPPEVVAKAEASPTRPWSAVTPADGVPKVVVEGHSDASTRPHQASTPPPTVDDGWGPPGTTIPPPFLGAMPGADKDDWEAKAQIPIPEDDDEDEVPAPALLVAADPPPSAPPPSAPIAARPDPITAARALERASTRLVELLRGLDHVTSRDDTIDQLLGYLGESHERVAFLAVKNGQLSPFLQRPPSPAAAPSISLDAPSTFQDAVGTRLPYRGSVADDTSRKFLEGAFGVPPAEVLILPIAVKDRVVAVLYGDGRRDHTFDEHFAIAGRAAGLALERILQAKRAQTER